MIARVMRNKVKNSCRAVVKYGKNQLQNVEKSELASRACSQHSPVFVGEAEVCLVHKDKK